MNDPKKQLTLALAKKGVPPEIIAKTIKPGGLPDKLEKYGGKSIRSVTFTRPNRTLSLFQQRAAPPGLLEDEFGDQPEPMHSSATCSTLAVKVAHTDGKMYLWSHYFDYTLGDKIYGDSILGWQRTRDLLRIP